MFWSMRYELRWGSDRTEIQPRSPAPSRTDARVGAAEAPAVGTAMGSTGLPDETAIFLSDLLPPPDRSGRLWPAPIPADDSVRPRRAAKTLDSQGGVP